MFLYTVENPHSPSSVTLVRVDSCEVCKALVPSIEYEEHVSTHYPSEDTPMVETLDKNPTMETSEVPTKEPRTRLQTTRGKS